MLLSLPLVSFFPYFSSFCYPYTCRVYRIFWYTRKWKKYICEIEMQWWGLKWLVWKLWWKVRGIKPPPSQPIFHFLWHTLQIWICAEDFNPSTHLVQHEVFQKHWLPPFCHPFSRHAEAISLMDQLQR